MKKPLVAILALVALLAFAACGTGTEDAAGQGAHDPAARSENGNGSGNETPPPSHEPCPAPASTPESRFVYENAAKGIHFSIDVPGFAPDSAERWSAALPMDAFLFPGARLFVGTVPPSGWHEFRVSFTENDAPEQFWRQPDEPSRVFVTERGVTVVLYENMLQRVSYFDGEPAGPEERAAVFVFRADGRDYREIGGAQILYSVFATERFPFFGPLFETRMEEIQSALDSLRFYGEPAPLRLPVSETGRSLGITQANFPRINGSTSALPLTQSVFGEIFAGDPRAWDYPYLLWHAFRTVPSYELLIAGELDLIIVPEPSAHVLRAAERAGVGLEFVPVATEALVFVTHADNPVGGVTAEQIIDIYANRTVTNWRQLGGGDGRIIPFNRNTHSGSQALMENLVLQGREVHPELEGYRLGAMDWMLSSVGHNWASDEPGDFGLGYTVFFFLDDAALNRDSLKILALDGVFPSRDTILSGEYPLATNYFAVIRADAPEGCPARLIANWLESPEGQAVAAAAGFGAVR